MSRDEGSKCSNGSYHVARNSVFSGSKSEAQDIFDAPLVPTGLPMKCDVCDYVFTKDDNQSRSMRPIYVRDDTGEDIELGRAPVGACWDADWYDDDKRGPDGRSLIVKTPGGDWLIDGRASNCTMKDDKVHRCWVRHGRPEDGSLHVDKNGKTCAAGAGSIQMGSYHGFLHNGHLTDC